MLDEKDLQAIAALMDKKLEPINTRLDKLEAGQADMKTEMAEMKTELQAEIKASESRMMALMEGYFEPKFNLLADGHTLMIEQMARRKDLEEAKADVDMDLDMLKAVVRQHSREIQKLKKVQ